MSYRTIWTLPDGTPAPGLDLGTVKPGETKSIGRKLKNTGDQPLSAVQMTLVDNLPGVTVTVGGETLIPGQMHAAPGLAPGESLDVTYARTVPPDAEPGVFRVFIRIRALT
ncbi:hypothetical protein SAMN04488058_101287 [Deinococcus reticulitermitis]|uniref:DUF11 domain-containing protein n=1 Tax=Deinococcus reticulitermitis TaxID=856736 RepID=A0A1H6SFE5_9DEIO|nr:hypothetical protein [Deinococcus reticulitermitis]SEI66653.1 hypothetical protein SAMN04488058_101287 [Deinococcus reticulitermitis]